FLEMQRQALPSFRFPSCSGRHLARFKTESAQQASMPESATQVAVAAPEQTTQPENDLRWKQVTGLPCDVSVEVPVPGYRVRDLLELQPDSVISSQWLTTA